MRRCRAMAPRVVGAAALMAVLSNLQKSLLWSDYITLRRECLTAEYRLWRTIEGDAPVGISEAKARFVMR